MSPMMQTLVVVALVLAAAVYAGRKVWRTLRPAKAAGCDTGCGCGTEGSSDEWAKT